MSAPPVDWRGINHSRMTEAMEDQLADMPTAFLALSRLRRRVGDGRSITLSGGVRGWAEWLGCARGYPKVILKKLVECGFADVVYGDDGDVTIRVMPPMSTRRQRRPAAPIEADPGASDRSLIDPDPNQPSPHSDEENADFSRSTVDHPIMYESCHKQQQQHDADSAGHSTNDPVKLPEPRTQNPEPEIKNSISEPAQRSGGAPYTETDRTAARVALEAAMLKQPKADPIAVAKALAGRPNGTLAQFLGDLAAAESRPDVETPLGLVLAAWADGKGVAAQRPARSEPRPAPQQRRGRRVPAADAEKPIDVDKFTTGEYASIFQRGGDVRLPPATPAPVEPPDLPRAVPPAPPRPARPETTTERPLEPAPQRDAYARWRRK